MSSAARRDAPPGSDVANHCDGTLAGAVVEALPSGLYRVRLDEGSAVVAHVADRIARNFIRVLVGDRVLVELSRAVHRRGRIVEKIG